MSWRLFSRKIESPPKLSVLLDEAKEAYCHLCEEQVKRSMRELEDATSIDEKMDIMWHLAHEGLLYNLEDYRPAGGWKYDRRRLLR